MGEVINATIAYINNKDITIGQLMKHLPGPDFPTGGVIIGKEIINKDTTKVEVLLKLEVKLILKKKGAEKL